MHVLLHLEAFQAGAAAAACVGHAPAAGCLALCQLQPVPPSNPCSAGAGVLWTLQRAGLRQLSLRLAALLRRAWHAMWNPTCTAFALFLQGASPAVGLGY